MLAGVSGAAHAQTVTGAARVSTNIDVCVPISHEQFQRVLAIELGTSIEFAPDAAKEPDGTLISVTCKARGIELQLRDSVTRKSMQRSVELPQLDIGARSRLLALAVAEFVVASWMELRLAHPPPIEPVGPTVSPEAKQQASRVARSRLPAERTPSAPVRWLIGASAEALLFARGSGPLGQVSLQAEQRPIPQLAINVSVGIAHGWWTSTWDTDVPLEAALTSTSGRLTIAYVADLGDFELLVGAGARFGVLHFAGVNYSDSRVYPEEFYAPWGSPVLRLAGIVHWEQLRLGVELEPGYVTLPVEAQVDEMTFMEVSGVWGSVGLSVGWLF